MINWYNNLDNLKWPHLAVFVLIFLLSYVECQSCPPLSLPAYGEWPTGSCVNTVGQRCLFGCQRGFELIGSSHRTCCENGSWTGEEAVCINQQIRCAQLIIPSDGRLIGDCLPYAGGTCNIQCFSGTNRLIRSVCNIDGSWSEPSPRCTPLINCPNIVGFANGRIDGACSPGIPGSTCSFSCNPGFTLVGLSTLVCSPTGYWSGAQPVCAQRMCPPLPSSVNIILTGNCSPGIVGSTCSYACTRGFVLRGPSQLTCTATGEWSSQPPTCEPVGCQPLSRPLNGQLNGSCNPSRAMESCTLICDYCYTPSSNPSLTCSETGQWSDPLPSCLPITCSRLPSPMIGTYSGNCNPGLCGQACVLNCGPNYVTPRSEILCTPNGWNIATPPTCVPASCPPLPPIPNGLYEGACSPGLVGSSCIYRCNYGYALIGRPSFDCLAETGNWTADPLPICTPVTCPSIVPPPGGSIIGNCSSATFGSTCSIICSPPLNLQGEPTLTCTGNGSWSNPIPSCIEPPPVTCPALVPPINGQLIGTCTPGYSLRTCSVQCTGGTVPSGPNELTCLPQGNWNNPVPLCVTQSCPDIGNIQNGVSRGDCSPGVPGRLCSFICNNGYSLQNGLSQVECYPNGTWSGFPPLCLQINCEPLARPSPNGGLQGSCNPGYVGEQCIFTCPPGYRLIGATNALCQPNGTWSAIPPNCILATCPSLTSPICGYAYGTCAPGALGETCTFTCAQGCVLDGSEVLTCLERGRWSDFAPVCRAIDPTPGPDPGPDPVTDPVTDDPETTDYPDPDPDPDPGPSPQPTPATTTPGGPNPTGVPPLTVCPSLRPPRGGVLYGKCAPGIARATCTVVCSRGYRLYGRITATCTATGQWSGRLGICRVSSAQYGQCCPIPTVPLNGRLSRCSNLMGGKCWIACAAGYRANVAQPLTCRANGNWNYNPASIRCTRQTRAVMFVWRWLG